MERGHKHCGECAEFPCQKLMDFAYDPEYGDENGSVLEALRQWRKEETVKAENNRKEKNTND